MVDFFEKKDIVIQNPIILAGAGWTTTKLLEEINAAGLEKNYGLVALMIGVNNQYRGIDIEVFKKEFTELFEKSITLANYNTSRVVVISIPDWSVTPFAKFKNHEKIVREINTYNEFIKSKCDKKKVHFVDVTKPSQNMAVDKTLITSDSLHPSKKMYRVWAKRIGKKLLKTL